MHRRSVLLTLAVVILAVTPRVASAEVRPFDVKAFEEAQAAGHGVVVDVHATW